MDKHSVSERYYGLFESHLARPEEVHLLAAAELGRELVSTGRPIEEIAEIHEDALNHLAEARPDMRLLEVVRPLSAPLTEMLMAYGLAFRERTQARKQAEEALHRFKHIVSSSTDMLALLDKDFVYLAANEAYWSAFGRTDAQLVGHSMAEVFGNDFFEATIRPNAERCLAGEEVRYTAWLEFPVSGRRYMDIAYSPYVDADGEIKGIVVCARNITERKRAEDAVAESEQRYRGIFDESVATIYVFDAEKNFIESNRAGLDLLGYSREELLSMSIPDVDADPVVVLPAHERLLSGHSILDYEHQLKRKDGTIITVLNNSRPLTDAEGNVVGMQSTLIDITERKRAEQNLQEAEAELKHTIEVVPGIIAKANAHIGYFTRCNPALSSILGFSSEEFLARPFIEFVHPDDRQSTINEVEKQLKGSPVARFENRYICKDGSYKWLEWRATAADEKGVVYAAATDITDRKRAEAALRKQADLNQTLLDSLPPVAMLIRPHSRVIVACNRAGEEGGAAPGKTCFQTWVQRDSPCPWCLAPQLWTTGEAQQLQHEDLGRVWDAHWVPVADDLYLHYTYDITERKRAEEALRRSEKLDTLGILAAGIAHDFGGLAALISQQVELARSAAGSNAESIAHLEVARQAVRQASGMTRALEGVVHHTPSEKRVVSIGDACREAQELLKRLIGVAVIQKWDITEEPLNVLADPTQIQQVLMNLVANARDAMPAGGTVSVRLTGADVGVDAPSVPRHAPPGKYARLDVADTGAGMTDEVRMRIFEPLFTTRENMPRTGLGLAIVHRIVEDHDGWIEVESQEGAGSTFSVFLPCRDVRDQHEAEKDDDALRAPPGTSVLVIEGDELQRSVFATALRDAGYDVEQVGSGTEALKAIRARVPAIHFAVADVELPDMAGTACLQQIQAVSRDTSGLLVMDRREDPDITSEADRCGYPILVKPFEMRDLTRSLAELLSQRSPTR